MKPTEAALAAIAGRITGSITRGALAGVRSLTRANGCETNIRSKEN